MYTVLISILNLYYISYVEKDRRLAHCGRARAKVAGQNDVVVPDETIIRHMLTFADQLVNTDIALRSLIYKAGSN